MPPSSRWQRRVEADHASANRALARALPEYSVPIADSRWSAPGYFILDQSYYCYPDVMYPWDPAVIAAVREFEPSAYPVTVRSTWRRMNYGNPEPLFTLVHHGIATVVRDAVIPTHEFRCEMPAQHEPGLHDNTTAHVYARRAPNYFQVHYYNREDKPYRGIPYGTTLPHDWAFYHLLQDNYENVNRSGADIADELLQEYHDEEEREERSNEAEEAYVSDQIANDFNEAVSDLEWKKAFLGEAPTATENPST